MGYNISSLHNVPQLNGYYFILVGDRPYNSGIAEILLYDEFDVVAQSIGEKSSIVQSFEPRMLNREILLAFHDIEFFRNVHAFMNCRSSGLLITSEHPLHIKDDNCILAIITFETLNKVYKSKEELVRDIIDLSMERNFNLFDKCSNFNKGVGFFSKLKQSIELSPNLWGIGIDLKKLFKNDDFKDKTYDLFYNKE